MEYVIAIRITNVPHCAPYLWRTFASMCFAQLKSRFLGNVAANAGFNPLSWSRNKWKRIDVLSFFLLWNYGTSFFSFVRNVVHVSLFLLSHEIKNPIGYFISSRKNWSYVEAPLRTDLQMWSVQRDYRSHIFKDSAHKTRDKSIISIRQLSASQVYPTTEPGLFFQSYPNEEW
jgi:hypothetical protein